MALGKIKISIFDRVLKLFNCSRELPSQIQDFGFNRNKSLCETSLHNRLRLFFYSKKVIVPGEFFDLFTCLCFLNFLNYYPAKFDIKGLIEPTDC